MFSVVVITKNEAANIDACLKPLVQVSDDIIIIDAFSQDATPELARQWGARVIQTEWKGYAQNKNFGNLHARHDWILSIDADEVISEELVQTLQTLSPEPHTVYELDRLTNYCGKWIRHSGWYPDWKVRLFDRREVQWQGAFVHETLAVPTGFQSVRVKGKLLHYSYKTREDHWQRVDRYATLSAKELHARGKKATFVKRWLSPVFRFLRTFIINRAFLDGKAGWAISVSGARLVRRKYSLLKEMEQSSR
ncbi:MAG: glycosyltransferase family 2 protein [Saprospirales bacterium]|nr:glycosyltransferase family 2 protein [Saprospirales bacterium]